MENPSSLQFTGLSSGVTAIPCFSGYACAIAGVALSCWGINNFGQIGTATNAGTNAINNTPVAVTGMNSGVTAVTARHVQACAIQSGGLKCWGRNQYGELGNPANIGNSNANASPLTVTGLGSGF